MTSPATSYEPPPLSKYSQARFVVDASDVQAARDLGLLRDDVVLDSKNSVAENYGLVYDRLENLAKHEFASQKAARSSFKEFAVRCGFQIFVKQTSVKPNNSGNAKYRCKKLHGAQFFHQNTPVESLECPFFVNVLGFNGKWKVTKMNLAHNHVKHVGFTQVPFVEGSVPTMKTSLHNTTQDIEQLTTLVMTEMLPMLDRTTATLTGSAIQEFLISKGHKLGKTGISRMKMDIDDRLRGDLSEIGVVFQKKDRKESRQRLEN